MIATDALPALEAEARERQGTRTDLVPRLEQSYNRSVDNAAALFGVNAHYVADAKRIAQEAPDAGLKLDVCQPDIDQDTRRAYYTAILR
jgi:hypothetical protein